MANPMTRETEKKKEPPMKTEAEKKGSRVYLFKNPRLGKIPADWSLFRLGTGTGRCEGHGFKTIKEARDFAKEWGHTIVKCVCGQAKKDGVIHRQDGPCYYLAKSTPPQ